MKKNETKLSIKSLIDLPLQNLHERLLQGYEKQLKVLGYQRRFSGGVRELLYWMEAQNLSLDQITSKEIKSYQAYLEARPNLCRPGGLSGSTISGYLFMIKLFFSYTQKIGVTKINPTSLLDYKKPKPDERQVLSQLEIERLYASCKDDRERAILSLFYGCGLRKSEAERLNKKDVDLSGKWLYVRLGKGRKRRVIPMSDRVVSDLKNYQYDMRPGQETIHTTTQDKKAFMLNKKGTRMRGGSYWLALKKLLKRSDLSSSISLHHLRHTIATHLLSGGMKIEQVRDFLGHEQLETTQVYTRVFARQLKIN